MDVIFSRSPVDNFFPTPECGGGGMQREHDDGISGYKESITKRRIWFENGAGYWRGWDQLVDIHVAKPQGIQDIEITLICPNGGNVRISLSTFFPANSGPSLWQKINTVVCHHYLLIINHSDKCRRKKQTFCRRWEQKEAQKVAPSRRKEKFVLIYFDGQAFCRPNGITVRTWRENLGFRTRSQCKCRERACIEKQGEDRGGEWLSLKYYLADVSNMEKRLLVGCWHVKGVETQTMKYPHRVSDITYESSLLWAHKSPT